MSRTVKSWSKQKQPVLKFSTYSFSELLEIKQNLEGEIQSRQANEIEELRAKITGAAHALGVTVEQIFGLPSGKKRVTRHARGPQPARYRGPTGEEWSGRGPAPRWMKPLLAKGKTKEDFLIK
jgi:DNA-binding protein H-NS